MSILKYISKHSTALMPICSIIGFLIPSLSNAVLPWLAKILFFLMFFTLLGINQKTLFKNFAHTHIWLFALLQNVGICITLTTGAYLVGFRGDMLLAISALSATCPLFGSAAIVNAMGFDALRALSKTITATLVMPFTLFVVLMIFASDDASIDIIEYVTRLVIYIVCPILLSVAVKRYMPKETLDKYYPKIAQCNIFLVLAFPLGLAGGFRASFDQDPQQALMLFITGFVLVASIFAITFLAYYKTDKQRAIIAATVSTGRNMVLTYSIATPFVGTMFLPLVGAILLPMYGLPFVSKALINRLK